ncbi:hypothetical protein G4X40_20335 [Rhodococcus sp. D2-41]|uniref:hypothetical protein n=1 Tax=Speluncibacter jeojiensis TaxID=2710754 RepID=UPI00240F20D6|nr:hypothetical protein [Rhodococcus sp. D2-41]MDG3012492.1 hypothetical protein [Rhodococcus sp. D2-41]
MSVTDCTSSHQLSASVAARTVYYAVQTPATGDAVDSPVARANEFEPTFQSLTLSDVASIAAGMVLIAAVLLMAGLVIA